MSEAENLQELIDQRQQLLASDIEWNDQGESALAELDRIQSKILAVDLTNDKLFALAMHLLTGGDDEPNFADDFKNDLFHRLREASSH